MEPPWNSEKPSLTPALSRERERGLARDSLAGELGGGGDDVVITRQHE
jgi:hypothetical protein